MEKIEIDPKLFITCRLCLEDMGVYQIIPIIQQKIKYCFDIDVAPFDRLPQLICKTCESKLSEYYTLKSIYIEKQESLKSKVSTQEIENKAESVASLCDTETVNEKTEQVDFTSRTPDPKENNIDTAIENATEEKRHIKRRFTFPASDSDSEGNKILPKKVHQRSSNSWRKKYITHFKCRFCSTSCSKRSAIFKHYSKYHSNMQKYAHIINSFCVVNMNKIDNRPNITGKLDTVVLNKNNIICNDMNNKYYIVYQRNKKKKQESTPTNKNIIEELSSDSSNDMVIANNMKRRKNTFRLLSTDTVVIDKQDNDSRLVFENENVSSMGTNHCQLDTSECINIDSESDAAESQSVKHASESYTSIQNETSESTDLKSIRNIIETCHNRYIKKKVSSSPVKSYADIETQLKHKILSLGSKIVNKQGLNCAGLLKFLEYRNLGIHWIPRASDDNAFHIRTKIVTLKRDSLHSDDSDIGWINIKPSPRTPSDGSSNGPSRTESNRFNKIVNKTGTLESEFRSNNIQEQVNPTIDKSQKNITPRIRDSNKSQEQVNSMVKDSNRTYEKVAPTGKDSHKSEEKVNTISKDLNKSKEKLNSTCKSKDSNKSQEKVKSTCKDPNKSQEKVNTCKDTNKSQEKINFTCKDSNKYQEKANTSVKDSHKPQENVNPLVKDSYIAQENVSITINDSNKSQEKLNPIVKDSTITEDSNENQEKINPIIKESTTIKDSKKYQEKVNSTIKDLNQAVLYKNIDSDNNTNSKLLNANPVANPKQLPKSVYHYDAKFNRNMIETNTIEIETNDRTILIEVDDKQNFEANLCMPKITSTTSLATTKELTQAENVQLKDKGRQEDNNLATLHQKNSEISHMPRIKVKPVSELMAIKDARSSEPLVNSGGLKIWQSNQTTQQSVNYSTHNNIVNFFPNFVLTPVTNVTVQPVIQLQTSNIIPASASGGNLRDKTNNPEYIVLHTVELPNSRTNSPYAYLQRLMSMHNIFVSDSELPLAQQDLLIKFKVLFKQENLHPVVLCLSLYYSQTNRFSFVIKDDHNKFIRMPEMSVNWQWEIIKIYQGDVSKKVLENAIKTGLQVHEDTKKFLCLLKSIHKVSE